MYRPCSANEDCLDPNSRCVDSGVSTGAEALCFCQPLFQYRHDKRRCEQVCSSLGSSFTKHKDVYVRGYNIWKDKPISLADCKQQCLQQGENCLSIDYQNNNSKCRLNSISQQDATDAGYLGSEAGDNVYTRDCEN